MPRFSDDESSWEESQEKKAIEDNQGQPRSKFAAEVQKAASRDDRAQVAKREKRIAPSGKDEETGIEYLQGRVFEPRCHVCQHPHRDWIEMMLIKGASYKGLQQRVPPLQGHEKLDRRSISNHHKNHMDLKDAAIRAILEREADLQSQDYKEGVEDAITKRGVLEVMLRKGFDDIVNNVTTVEARDLIQLAKVLGDMDSVAGQVGLDEARAQVQIFIQAIKNVCDLEQQGEIAEEVRRLRSRENIDTRFEDIITSPPLVQIEVGDATYVEVENPDG